VAPAEDAPSGPGATVTGGPATAQAAAPVRLDDRLLARGLGWWHARAPWQQVLIVFAVTRVFAFVLVELTARFQAVSLWTPTAHPGYLDMIDNWDGSWYQGIAAHGYPAVLPRSTSTGQVLQNEWAFYPVYPFLVAAVMWLTGLSWAFAGSLVALACGAGAVVAMRGLVEQVAGRGLAFWTVVLFCCFPSAPVLQVTYTESLAVLLLVVVLTCLQRGRYLRAMPVVVALALTRPIGVPVAAVVGLHVLGTWWRARPGTRTIVAQMTLVATACLSAFAWPVIAGVGTGVPNAYSATMGAWRSNAGIVPVTPWWYYSQYLAGRLAGPVLLLTMLGLIVWWITRRSARVIAGDLRLWLGCYLGYLLLVLSPSTSLFRYLLLAFPFGTMTAAISPARAYRAAVAVAFLAAQTVWVAWLWRFSPPLDWAP